jgi:hypothetical protein
MLKKIKPENIFKIIKINKNGYLRVNYAPESAKVISCVIKLKNNKTLPQIDDIPNEAEMILTSDNKKDLDQFSRSFWIDVDLILKKT